MKRLGRLLDLLLAGCLASGLGLAILLRSRFRRRWRSSGTGRRLLVLDMSYTLDAILQRQLQTPVLARDLDGFFEKVWSVHPLGTMSGELTVKTAVLNERHCIIEGTIKVSPALGPFSNFALAQLALVSRLEDLIQREGISLIRVGDPYYLGLMGLLLAWLTARPVAMRLAANHDRLYRDSGRPMMPGLFRYRWLEKLVEWFVFPRMDLVAALNQENLDYALWSGARKERTTIFRLGNLIHPSHFIPPEKRQRGVLNPYRNNSPVILSVARLEPVKMPEQLLYVLASLKDRNVEAVGLFIGDGSLGGELLELAEHLGLSGQVHLLGNKDQEWLSRALVDCDVVVSFVTGRALAEAALAGAAVVCYDLDWQKELIVNGMTGELVAPGEPGAMAGAVIRVLEDRALAARYGAKLRERALELLEPERLNEHERTTYLNLLRGYRPGREG